MDIDFKSIDMYTFNSNNFIKSLKESYDKIPVLQGDAAAKTMVADSIKSHGFNPADVYSFIYSKMTPSIKLSEADWKSVIEAAIKRGGFFGQILKEYKTSLKGKLSYEEMFNLAASCCGVNPSLLCQELCLNKMNWSSVVENLIKTSVDRKEEKKAKTPVEKPAAIKESKKKVVKKTPATKTSKVTKIDPRSKSITLVCEKTGEVKTWPSYRACEKELYNDPKLGHGTVSQLLNPKKGLKHLPGGWALPKEEMVVKATAKKSAATKKTKTKVVEKKTPVKTQKGSIKHPVCQMVMDKKGKLKVVKTFPSITEAAKATGIYHTSISKSVTGTYQSAGGYVWKSAEAAA